MAPRRAHTFAVVALATLSAAAALSLGRVFASASFALPVVGAAVLPHAMGLVERRSSWRFVVVLAVSVAAAGLYAVWVVEPSTTWLGIPTLDSLETLGRDLERGFDDLRTAVVPAPVTDGALLLAVLAAWAVAQTADLLAFRRDATVAAVAPALALFLWASTLGDDELRLRTTIGFAVAAAVFLLLQHQALLEARRARFAGRRLGRHRLGRAGALTALVAVAGGVLIGPALPGAESAALIDVKAIGRDGTGGGSYRTEPPLARIGENFIEPNEVALFSVRAPAPDYWRIVALDQYSSEAGGQWTLTAAGSEEVASGLRAPSSVADALVQEFRIVGLGGRWMPAAYEPVDVDGGDPLVVKASSTLVTGNESVRGLRYTVRSRVPPDPATAASGTGPAVPADLAVYSELPGDFPDDVRRLASEATAGATTPYERASALEQFFLDPNSGFTYSLAADVELGPGAQSESAIREFLFTRRRGFCVQFAGSYAVMARAVGLPARVAVGYTPGDYDPQDGVYRVTSYDAHAWPEVWLEGAGWTRFEPTPPSALPGGSELPGRAAIPDAPTGTAPEPPTPTVATAPPATGEADTPATVDAARAPSEVSIDTPGDSDDDGTGLISFSWRLASVFAATLVLATLVTGAIIVIVKARRRRQRRQRAQPEAAVRGAWEETLDRLDEVGVRSRPELTPYELTEVALTTRVPAAAGPPLESLAATYTAVSYGPGAAGTSDAARAWTHVDEIRAALRSEASVAERLRRRVDPAPLRRGR